MVCGLQYLDNFIVLELVLGALVCDEINKELKRILQLKCMREC